MVLPSRPPSHQPSLCTSAASVASCCCCCSAVASSPAVSHSNHHHGWKRRRPAATLAVTIITLSLLLLIALASVALVGPGSPSSPQQLRRLATDLRSNLRLRERRERAKPAAVPPAAPLDDGTAYDAIVLGCGPAGLTAALFAARAGLTVLVLGSESGSLSEATSLDNFPSWDGLGSRSGFHSGSGSGSFAGMQAEEALGGPGWLASTKSQAAALGARFAPPGLLATGLTVHASSGGGDDGSRTDAGSERQYHFSVSVPDSGNAPTTAAAAAAAIQINSRSVIVATGSTSRRLGLPNEDKLWGRSLHSCAICDGSNYAGGRKTVLVVGGGDAAVDAALLLSRHAGRVVLVHRRAELRASNLANIQAMKRADNIEVLMPYVVEEWRTDPKSGGTKLVGARLSRGGSGAPLDDRNEKEEEKNVVSIDGAFVMIGASPNTGWLRDTPSVRLTEDGLIGLIGDGGTTGAATSQPGLFGAGEVVDARYRQAVTAAADGARAAIDAERWLRRQTRPGNIGNGHADLNGGAPPIRSIQEHGASAEVTSSERKATTTTRREADGAGKHNDDDASVDYNDADPDRCNLTTEECIKTIVSRHAVVVFSKPWCPYCKRAIEALALEGVAEPYIIDLSPQGMGSADRGRQVQVTLENMTGRRTVPNVFIGGNSIGGGDETTALHRQGKLKKMLEAATFLSWIDYDKNVDVVIGGE